MKNKIDWEERIRILKKKRAWRDNYLLEIAQIKVYSLLGVVVSIGVSMFIVLYLMTR